MSFILKLVPYLQQKAHAVHIRTVTVGCQAPLRCFLSCDRPEGIRRAAACFKRILHSRMRATQVKVEPQTVG